MTWTLPTNVTDFVSFSTQVNAMLGGDLLPFMFLLVVFSISFMGSLGRFETEKSLLFASWITAVSAGFLMVVFGTSATIVLIPAVAFIGTMFFIWKS